MKGLADRDEEESWGTMLWQVLLSQPAERAFRKALCSNAKNVGSGDKGQDYNLNSYISHLGQFSGSHLNP